MTIILLQCHYAILCPNKNIKWISFELKERKMLPFIIFFKKKEKENKKARENLKNLAY